MLIGKVERDMQANVISIDGHLGQHGRVWPKGLFLRYIIYKLMTRNTKVNLKRQNNLKRTGIIDW